MSSIAVIDIGSNSIKVLVAARAGGDRLTARMLRTIEARIGAGLSQNPPRLAADSMARGVAAVAELAAEASTLNPDTTLVVATSAVRDAVNGVDFCAQVRAATGLTVRILSGQEEANLIGQGLLCDPLLGDLRDFYLFDLGGGSLEILSFRERKIVQSASLPLGCVRLTEKFLPDPTEPFEAGAGAAIAAHVHAVIADAHFSLVAQAAAIGTGGTLTVVRAVLGARSGLAAEQVPPRLEVAQLRDLLARIGPLPLTARKQVAGLPPARADVFPAALATMIAVADLGGFDAFQYSSYNLRWGLAAEALR